jgi:chloramphenicol-sensitive protein RarD
MGNGPVTGDGRAPRTEHSKGLLYGFAAYLMWGVLPLYFLILAPTGAFEIVAWRVLFSLVFCAIMIATVRGGADAMRRLLRRPRTVMTMGLAGALIYVNWQTYVVAATTGHVVEAALGYFINPMVTVLLGVLVLRERLRPAQWAAVGMSVAAVVVLTVGYGSLPWIGVVLALSFGAYGLIKKQVGDDVDALTGLTLETAWLVPVAVIQLIVVGMTSGLTFGTISPLHTVGLLAAGVVTAVPLLLFASAARRVPLSVIGLLQFLTPVMQFLVGVFLLHEPMPPERWIGFGLVWVALVMFTVDMLLSAHRSRTMRPVRSRGAVPADPAGGAQ